MWLNLIKMGGYAMMSKEIINRINDARRLRELEQRRAQSKGLALGLIVGSALGAAGGILFAPRSGQETRAQISAQAGETYEAIKENVADAKSRFSSTLREKSQRVKDAAQACGAAAEEALEAGDEESDKA